MILEKETIGFWEKAIKLVEANGYWKLFKIVLFIAFTITIIYLGKNFGENFSFERQRAMITDVINETDLQKNLIHTEQMQMRENIKPYITSLLKDAIVTMGADRAFIIELHNGSNNKAGLPFIHCTMTYEEVAQDIEPIDEDYQNLSLSRFNFPDYLHTHDLWFGTIDEFAKIDQKAAGRLRNACTTYFVITTIRSCDNEIGYFGFMYCDDNKPKDSKEIMEFVVHAVQKLSKWLDNNPLNK